MSTERSSKFWFRVYVAVIVWTFLVVTALYIFSQVFSNRSAL